MEQIIIKMIKLEVLMANNSETESRIGQYFDAESKEMYDLHQKEGIPQSMQTIVTEIGSKELVLDIGSGPGSLLIGLLENGVTNVIGMDLSQDMLDIAKQRLEEKGFAERGELMNGNFLELEINQKPDAITFHRVLCCHPDRKGMVGKAVDLKPKLISVTIPRDWKFFRVMVFFYGLIAKLKKSFRPYIHSQNEVDSQFKELGYEIKSRNKEFWWVTTTYERI